MYREGEVSVRIHPIVVVSILQHFNRRQEDEENVSGALLGHYVHRKYEVTDCYALKSGYRLQAAGYHDSISALLKRINPQETVVGWYSTGKASLPTDSAKTYDSFCRRAAHPICVHVDTSFGKDDIVVKSFLPRPLVLREKVLGMHFPEIPTSYVTSSAEQSILDVLIPRPEKVDGSDALSPIGDINSAVSSLRRFVSNVDRLIKLVDEILKGKRKPNATLGWKISSALSGLPDPETFEGTVQTLLMDLLMTLYVSGVMNTQVSIAERLLSSKR